ncbi:NAD-P-binding protein [Sistotremastrum niveocremeum HHB9708]|uniref:NAD-P-binding protein n=1 Tax=Sistotremastrum niveocremeum HHB9708 TaxID=1314777 RepID=A0A164N738_9AGAM|nr:NAD-P-binding protein [Sistotremastrum niveocremeum HHB9708]
MSIPLEDLSVTHHNDIYSAIDPAIHFGQQTYKDKVVFVTGASRGIGQEIATFYAKAGATVILVARQSAALDEVREAILKLVPGAQLATLVADVTSVKEVQTAVDDAVRKFGKLDIVVANAGKAEPMDEHHSLTQEDPDDWWRTMEVNVRGVYNVAHFALPYLDKTSGYFVIISSSAAQMRAPFASAYCISKHAVGRLNEFVKIEHPNVKSIALHPGGILTAMSARIPQVAAYLTDTLQLPAGTTLQLTSGRFDWLNGRYVSANWDLEELELVWKEKIIATEALVSRFQ